MIHCDLQWEVDGSEIIHSTWLKLFLCLLPKMFPICLTPSIQQKIKKIIYFKILGNRLAWLIQSIKLATLNPRVKGLKPHGGHILIFQDLIMMISDMFTPPWTQYHYTLKKKPLRFRVLKIDYLLLYVTIVEVSAYYGSFLLPNFFFYFFSLTFESFSENIQEQISGIYLTATKLWT